jgi:hypothetical protein
VCKRLKFKIVEVDKQTNDSVRFELFKVIFH